MALALTGWVEVCTPRLERRQQLTFLLLLLLWRLEWGSIISFPRLSAPKGIFGFFKNPSSKEQSVMCVR